MGNTFETWDHFKSNGFRDAYDEAHRRSPTPVKAPFVSTHFGVMHPWPFENYFDTYIQAALTFLVARQSEDQRATDAMIETWVDQINLYYNDSEDTALVEKLVFHFDEGPEANAIWRLEVHREFCTITIFSQLTEPEISTFTEEVKLKPADGRPRPPLMNDKFEHLTAMKLAFARHVTDCYIQQRGRAPREEVTDGRWGNPDSLKIFVDYIGVTLPISALGRSIEESKIFPAVESNGFSDTAEKVQSDKFKRANALLNEILRGPDLRKRFVRHADPANMVACYVFLGHFLLISGLGSRDESVPHSTVGDQSPGVFWLFYEDHLDPKVHDPVLAADATNRRASRLIYMLNTIGTARIAALFNMKKMKDFSQRLRGLELQALELRKTDNRERHSNDAVEKSLDFRKDLAAAENRVKESILYRANRTGYYRTIMNNLIADLGIESVPSWQGLDKFIRRRLDPSISYLAKLGERYEALNTLIANEWAISMGYKVYEFQKIADFLFPVLILYYLPHATESLGKGGANLVRFAFYFFPRTAIARKSEIEWVTRHAPVCGLDIGLAIATIWAGWLFTKMIVRFFDWLKRKEAEKAAKAKARA
jgi:hypothetical protein